jgi:hypothetical protein
MKPLTPIHWAIHYWDDHWLAFVLFTVVALVTSPVTFPLGLLWLIRRAARTRTLRSKLQENYERAREREHQA